MARLSTLLVLTLATAACGDTMVDETGPDAGGNADIDAGDAPDTTAPTIVSITPANGATGIRDDATVVFVFSEPMDQLSVQNSLDTSDLGGVSFEWTNGGATLTITPDLPLAYAEGAGNDPDATTATRYAVVLGTGATDEAGNNVEVGAETRFDTLKSMTTTLGRDNDLTAAGTPTGVITDDDDFLYIGDDDDGGTASAYRSYITMDLAPLPTTAVAIVSARLRGTQLAEIGNPYGALGSSTGVLIDHGSFTLEDANAANAAFNLTPLAATGVFANTGDTALSIDVTSEVTDDLANRAARSQRSQYRLRFTGFTNLDDTADYVLIGRTDLALDVVYLAP